MAGWFRGAQCRLLPVITGLAFSACVSLPAPAAEISFSDLRGYSIEAEWIINARVTEKNGKREPHNRSNRYVAQIYISNTGRIFHRQQGYRSSRTRSNTKPDWGGDYFGDRGSKRFRWDSNSTFVMISVPSPDKEKTTYVRIIRIALSQSDGSYSCTVKVSRALQKGEKQYIQYEPSDFYWIIHSFRARQKSCRVFKGNVLEGQVGP